MKLDIFGISVYNNARCIFNKMKKHLAFFARVIGTYRKTSIKGEIIWDVTIPLKIARLL